MNTTWKDVVHLCTELEKVHAPIMYAVMHPESYRLYRCAVVRATYKDYDHARRLMIRSYKILKEVQNEHL